MEININEKIENPLLNRTEIHFDCTYQGEATPKVLEVKNRLVAVLNVDKNLLVVDKLKPHLVKVRLMDMQNSTIQRKTSLKSKENMLLKKTKKQQREMRKKKLIRSG